LTWRSERTGIENNWYALTDRVAALKVEADGDLHIALQDATGDKPGIVVVEVPEKPQWCEIRNMAFSWTRTRFPFHTSSAKKLNVTDPPVITVIGKAFSILALTGRKAKTAWSGQAREDCDLLSTDALQPAVPRTRGSSRQLHRQPTFSIRQLIGLPGQWMKSRIIHTCRITLTLAIRSIERRRQVRCTLVCKSAG
jgi:hypothetical protein